MRDVMQLTDEPHPVPMVPSDRAAPDPCARAGAASLRPGTMDDVPRLVRMGRR